MHYTILNWLFWPCFTWFLGSCDTWFLCCSMPHQAAATCPLTISNSNANGKGSKHGLKLGSKRTSACTNMWKHVIINFWRTWKPTSDASWNLIWRMCHCAKLGGTCPQDCLGSFARLFLLHWSLISIGPSSGGRTGTSSKLPGLATPCAGEAFTMRPGMLARLSTKAYNIMPGITFRWSCLMLFVASLPGIAGMMGHEPMPLSGMSPTSGNTFHKDDLRK